MTELELYKYINDSNIEWHIRDNDGTPDIIIFPLLCEINDFAKLVKTYIGDGGIECRLMDGYFAIWMKDLCDHYGIDMYKVFCGEEQ